MTFCFSCLSCGSAFERPDRSPAPRCPKCSSKRTIRDYRRESVNLGTGVYESRSP